MVVLATIALGLAVTVIVLISKDGTVTA